MSTRRRILISIISVVFTVGCAHQAASPTNGRPAAEQSVFPIAIPKSLPEVKIGGGVIATKYAACTAVYVAPHLMATSATAFPRTVEGTTAYNVAGIILRDGDYRLKPVDVVYEDEGNGIAIIRTEEVGTPVILNGLGYPIGRKLIVQSFTYKTALFRGQLLQPVWNVALAAPAVEPYTGANAFARFRIDVIVEDGACGAPVFDEDGRLAGIVHERHSGYTSVISALAIASALKGVP